MESEKGVWISILCQQSDNDSLQYAQIILSSPQFKHLIISSLSGSVALSSKQKNFDSQ